MQYFIFSNKTNTTTLLTVEHVPHLLQDLCRIDFNNKTLQLCSEVLTAIEDNSMERIAQSILDLTEELEGNERTLSIKNALVKIAEDIDIPEDIDVERCIQDFITALSGPKKELHKRFDQLQDEVNLALYEVKCLIQEKNVDKEYILDKLQFMNQNSYVAKKEKIVELIDSYKNSLSFPEDKKTIGVYFNDLSTMVAAINSDFELLKKEVVKLFNEN